MLPRHDIDVMAGIGIQTIESKAEHYELINVCSTLKYDPLEKALQCSAMEPNKDIITSV